MMPENEHEKVNDNMIPRWAIGVCLIIIVATTCIKIVVTDITSIDFSDLLSLVLALFSIGLSAKFYQMADVASRNFYDRSLSFTKEISVVLGRIDERVDKQLNNIVAGVDRVERNQFKEFKQRLLDSTRVVETTVEGFQGNEQLKQQAMITIESSTKAFEDAMSNLSSSLTVYKSDGISGIKSGGQL